MKYRYLGKLCLKGHDHEGTGKSLRDRTHACLKCKRDYLKRLRTPEYSRQKKAERIERERQQSLEESLRQGHKRHFELWPQIAELREQGEDLKSIGKKLFLSHSAISMHVNLAKKFGHYKPKKPKHTYLGSLCRRGHDYEGTGQSLRNHCDRNCVECRRQRAMEYKRSKSVNTAS